MQDVAMIDSTRICVPTHYTNCGRHCNYSLKQIRTLFIEDYSLSRTISNGTCRADSSVESELSLMSVCYTGIYHRK